jgi:proteasome accessory factor C
LEVSEDTIIADLREVEERDSYHAIGAADDFRITIEPTTVRIWSAHDIRRPTRLSHREATALWIGLEVARMAGDEGADQREALRSRLLRHLARHDGPEMRRTFAAPSLTEDPAGVRQALTLAAADRRPCRVVYLKTGSSAVEERRIHPYAIVHAEGIWYVLAHCARSNGVRTFRADRILTVLVEDGVFEVPEGFDPRHHLDVSGGRALSLASLPEAVVRYSPAVARWIAESEPGEWQADGSYLVRRRVADPGWLASHVLEQAGEAEVIDPPELRAAVAEAAVRLTSASPGQPMARGSRARNRRREG